VVQDLGGERCLNCGGILEPSAIRPARDERPHGLRRWLRARYIGLLVATVGATVAGVAYKRWRELPRAPLHVDVATAVDLADARETWVTVEGAHWRCAAGVRDRDVIAWPLHEPQSGRLVVVEYDWPTSCERVAGRPTTGLVARYRPDDLARLVRRGLDVTGQPAGMPVLRLCTYCAPSDALVSAALGLALFLGGIAMALRRPRAPPAFQTLRARDEPPRGRFTGLVIAAAGVVALALDWYLALFTGAYHTSAALAAPGLIAFGLATFGEGAVPVPRWRVWARVLLVFGVIAGPVDLWFIATR
jgi:hypothetical protein